MFIPVASAAVETAERLDSKVVRVDVVFEVIEGR